MRKQQHGVRKHVLYPGETSAGEKYRHRNDNMARRQQRQAWRVLRSMATPATHRATHRRVTARKPPAKHLRGGSGISAWQRRSTPAKQNSINRNSTKYNGGSSEKKTAAATSMAAAKHQQRHEINIYQMA